MNKAFMKLYKEIEKMALSEGDKAVCMEIAREIIKEAIKEHISQCPHGISFNMSKRHIAAFIIGCMLGSGIIAGGTGVAIARFIIGL